MMTMIGIDKKLTLVGNHTAESQKIVLTLKKMIQQEGFTFDEKNPEIVISVGGDGTLLKAMHLYENQLDQVRFVGVHTGHLGFYTDFLSSELTELVSALKIENKEKAVCYPLLKVFISFEDGKNVVHYALNESTIKRQSRTLVTDVKISDYLFEKFRGDGLSISTPTGSTAYNKSVGGAVMHPQVGALQLAEIASLNNSVFRTLGSPMIVAKKDIIKICPENAEDYSVTIDQLEFAYKNISSIEYSLNGSTISFANCAHIPFWERVKNSFIGDVC